MIDENTLRAAIPGALTGTDLTDLGRRVPGKVRDSYLQPGRRILIASDRLSAFDRVIASIPYKGQVLNQLAAWWFERTADVVPNHLIAVPDPNVSVAREAVTLPVEVVVRGYITGVTDTSLWALYQAHQAAIAEGRAAPLPYGLELPAGLRKNDRLPTPVITPTTKGLDGAHDVPLPASEVVARGLVEPGLWAEACAAVLELFHRGSEVAARAGLILVDTKYELGVIDGRLCVIDEIHTPDSSRYWLADTYAARHAAGEEPLGLDKEYVRRWLKSVGYAGEGPPPVMPDEVVVELARRYIDAYERLTGEAFVPAEQPAAARIQRALAGFVRAGAAAGEEQGNGGTL